ncbi:MAG: hypothetical protein ACJAQ6_002375 [Arenicella sp.]|jgi:uncharacterized protein YhhL (DUF1145 family)
MKNIILVFWLLCLIAFFGLIPEPAALWLKVVALLLLLAHAIEFIVFRKIIKRKGDSGLKSFFMTMLYGLFYFKV